MDLCRCVRHGARAFRQKLAQIDVRVPAPIVRKQIAAVVVENEQGSRKEQDKRDAAHGNHESEIGTLLVLGGQRIGGGRIGHIRWDALSG